MTRPALQHWRVVSVSRTATATRINTAQPGSGYVVPPDYVALLPLVGMGKHTVYWQVSLRIVKGVITSIISVKVAKTPFVEATLTRVKRLPSSNSVAYTVRYVDPFTGKRATYDGRSHLLWSELQPHGFERTMEAGVDHKVALRCEWNLAVKRVTSIPAPPLVVDEPPPPRSYAALCRSIGQQIADAARVYGREPREVVRDVIGSPLLREGVSTS